MSGDFMKMLLLATLVTNAGATDSTSMAGLPPVEVVGGASLPAVPAAVATAEIDAAAEAKQSLAAGSASGDSEPSTESNIALAVTPGTTELVRIARNYLNRIVTPFENPKLLTVNPVEVRTEGSSIYLTTSSEKPVGVHILSNDKDDTRSISLTLIPARIPPKTIQLTWAGDTEHAHVPVSSARAKRWEQSSSYEEKLLELVEVVARGEVPDGYALSETAEAIDCSLPGVEFFAGQRLTGSRFSVIVLRATNIGEATIELLGHAGCGAPGVALVAPWPHAHLDPGTSTELYVGVVNDTFEPQPRGQVRRSLLERSR